MRLLASSVFALLLVVGSAQGRTWTDSTGNFKTEAELVDFKDGVVRLRRADGNVVSVPVERLSETDQQYLQSLATPNANPEVGSVSIGTETAPPTQAEGESVDAGSSSRQAPTTEETGPDTASDETRQPGQPVEDVDPQGDIPSQKDGATTPPSILLSICGLLTGLGPLSLLTQYALLCGAAFAHIYQILHKRRDTVQVLSHRRFVVATLANLGVCLVFYHTILAFTPSSNKFLAVAYIFVAFLAMVPLRVVVQAIGDMIDQDRTLKDTQRSKAELFNCNWPLIPRCCNQSLSYLLMFGILARLYLNFPEFWQTSFR